MQSGSGGDPGAPDGRLSRRALLAGGAVTLVSASAAFPALTALADGPTERFMAHRAGSRETVDHAAWDELLSAYVVPGADGLNRVDYRGFKAKGHAALKAYTGRLAAVDPATLDRPEQFAYWANLYNAKTIDIVLDAYPVASIRDIQIGGGLVGLLKQSVGAGGPWQAPVVTVKSTQLSLDDIEHQILRPVFADARVHYAVNCASIGCPNLATKAWRGAGLDTDLDAAARAFVNHPRGVRADNGSVIASSIYSWFMADFGGTPASVLDHIRRFAGPDLLKVLADRTGIDSYEYDWTLNDTTPRKS
ncbi:MAG: DUF547 domain-containing protein [Hyphomicrobiaceae bacterium]|nr:DUF547 domain-containing protein [Hyphomicrobiaceae bacterium]